MATRALNTAPRLTRLERKAETRDALLEAAARVLKQRGYEGASIDDLAAAAGFTKGAFYSNFESKQDLVLALAEQYFRGWCQRIAEAYTVGEGLEDWLANGAAVLDSLSERENDMCLLLMEIWCLAARNPDLGERLAEIYEDSRARAADVIRDRMEKLDVQASIAPDDLATLILALIDGFLLQKQLAPARFPSGFLGRSVNTVFTALAALPAPAD